MYIAVIVQSLYVYIQLDHPESFVEPIKTTVLQKQFSKKYKITKLKLFSFITVEKISKCHLFFLIVYLNIFMDSKIQFQNSLVVTIGLIALTILSKVLTDSPHNLNTQSGVSLLSQALKWRKIASQDSQPFIKLQHLILANAYISAAR